MKGFRVRMKRRRPENRRRYEIAGNRSEKVNREDKNRVWKKIREDSKADHFRTKKLLYSMAKNYRRDADEQGEAIKDLNGQQLVQTEDMSNRSKDYFENILNVRGGEALELNLNLEAEPEEIIVENTEQEVYEEVAIMKRGKSTDDDNVPVEIVKEAEEDAQKLLLEIISDTYRLEILPLDWLRGVIIPIFKKGDKSHCGN